MNAKRRDLGLQRKNIDYNIDQVRSCIQQELDGPGCSGGYRTVWHTLRFEGIQVPREVVHVILKELDPDGVTKKIQNPTILRTDNGTENTIMAAI